MTDLLTIDGLTVDLAVEGARRVVLRDVSFDIGQGESVGLVGESGSGKSMTARAIARLLPNAAHQTGRIMFEGRDVAGFGGPELRAYREKVAVIFQDPRVHINPVRRIGDFMTEALRDRRGIRRSDVVDRAVRLLDQVGIADGRRRLDQYPHELSGGLLQRVMIATALLTEPSLLLADEPTTALDVTTQSEVMALIDDLRRDLGLAMLFITHDLDLAGAVCDRTVVLYAGQIMEEQSSAALHRVPRHPYTAGLIAARPDVARTAHRLDAIPGQPQSAFEAPDGCAFAPRCGFVEDRCHDDTPPLLSIDDGRVRCCRVDEIANSLMTIGSP
jgi:oligopeptide/dipeptide ABC transporter ATP-binding protein